MDEFILLFTAHVAKSKELCVVYDTMTVQEKSDTRRALYQMHGDVAKTLLGTGSKHGDGLEGLATCLEALEA